MKVKVKSFKYPQELEKEEEWNGVKAKLFEKFHIAQQERLFNGEGWLSFSKKNITVKFHSWLNSLSDKKKEAMYIINLKRKK